MKLYNNAAHPLLLIVNHRISNLPCTPIKTRLRCMVCADEWCLKIDTTLNSNQIHRVCEDWKPIVY